MPPPAVLLLLSLLIARSAADLAPHSDAAAILAFQSKADPSGALALPLDAGAPCDWANATCEPDGRVTRLVIESAGLNGTFPPDSLSRATELRVLSLKHNRLFGPIPADLAALSKLRALYLAGNLFSGPFPDALLSLGRLHTLDLSGNLLSGRLPPPLSSTPHQLVYLDLSSNAFSGAVPAFNQSTLRLLNLSFNKLSGPVPVTTALSAAGAAALVGNPELCGEVVRRECRDSHLLFFHGLPPSAAPVPGPPSHYEAYLAAGFPAPSSVGRKKLALSAGIAGGAFLLVALLGIIAVTRRSRRKTRQLGPRELPRSSNASDSDDDAAVASREMDVAASAVTPEEKASQLGRSGCLKFCAGENAMYTLEQLMRASAEVLGKGTVGTTYKAMLDGRLVVIVKRLLPGVVADAEVFERSMDAVGRLRHANLVPLRAYFQAKEERLLVYDYQPNGSLYSLIHGSKSSRAKPLHWTSCLKIAEDIVQGLAYIHQASRLVHGNLKSSNILLGADFEACLTDNCLSFLMKPANDKGSVAYKAPETLNSNGGLSPRADMYSLGVLLLELLTSKPPLEHSALAAADLQDTVRSLRASECDDDERLNMIVDIAAACVRPSPESRPTSWQVLKMIQEVKDANAGDNDNDNDSEVTGDS